jgi:hypothetical protein
MRNVLSTNLDSNSSVPYFLWDEPLTVGEIKHRLATGSKTERHRLLGKILREARDSDVWKFTTPNEVWENWTELSTYLGRRKAFWEFLFSRWKKAGLIG